ncbi:MAG TPA: biopolymer transporter ExbD [Candidatus Methylacidiphilales bacterium]|jgi:biopolymer transport protein ExbD|nr:biopolymer transporter ExbD [Candidatus Methylacidiphilales bacterium]
MQFARKPRRSPILNIIPLIDVLVVLLIFYIATTVFKKTEHNFHIAVPKYEHAAPAPDVAPTTIYVTKDSKIYLGDELMDPDLLGDTLKSKMAADPNFKVALKADTDAPFGAITKVMSAARSAGIADLPTYATGGDTGTSTPDSGATPPDTGTATPAPAPANP